MGPKCSDERYEFHRINHTVEICLMLVYFENRIMMGLIVVARAPSVCGTRYRLNEHLRRRHGLSLSCSPSP